MQGRSLTLGEPQIVTFSRAPEDFSNPGNGSVHVDAVRIDPGDRLVLYNFTVALPV